VNAELDDGGATEVRYFTKKREYKVIIKVFKGL
jgi:hypothetical protein